MGFYRIRVAVSTLRVLNFRSAHKLSAFGLRAMVYRVQIICREQKEAFKTLLLQLVARAVTNACERGIPSANHLIPFVVGFLYDY